jgi:hypothetical protein
MSLQQKADELAEGLTSAVHQLVTLQPDAPYSDIYRRLVQLWLDFANGAERTEYHIDVINGPRCTFGKSNSHFLHFCCPLHLTMFDCLLLLFLDY